MSGSKAGEKNPYWCPDCHGYVICVHVDDGVTPMFLACRVKGEPRTPGNDCKGMMRSMMYPPEPWPDEDDYGNPIPTEPTWEWYKPDNLQLAMMRQEQGADAQATIDHVLEGGLLLRKRA